MGNNKLVYLFRLSLLILLFSCGTQGQQCCPYGWPAARGWDAVTGLGSFRNVVHNAQLFPSAN